MRLLLPTILACACLATPPARALVNRRTPVVEAVERVMPCVVNIGTERRVKTTYTDPLMRFRNDLLDEFFSSFFGSPPIPGYRYVHSLGSGVIVHPDGYILTNYHVIERASRIRVLMSDETTYEAQFLAGDEVSDIALIKVEAPAPLPAVAFAEDDDLLLGETVICMGNPYGLADSVTVGVLSAKNREARYGDRVLYRDILQTDAAVNPGNSGGPLLNINGELIGINVAIYQKAENIGFAVPVKRARALLSRWFSPGARKLWLGFEPTETNGEVRVLRVDPGGPAAGLSLKEGDRLKRVNDTAVSTLFDFNRALLAVRPGEKARVALDDGRELDLELVSLPKPDGARLALDRLGIEFDAGSSAQAQSVFPAGLFVKSVARSSSAARAGLLPGMLVMRINETELRSMDDAGLALESVRENDPVRLDVVKLIPAENFTLAQRSQLHVVAD